MTTYNPSLFLSLVGFPSNPMHPDVCGCVAVYNDLRRHVYIYIEALKKKKKWNNPLTSENRRTTFNIDLEISFDSLHLGVCVCVISWANIAKFRSADFLLFQIGCVQISPSHVRMGGFLLVMVTRRGLPNCPLLVDVIMVRTWSSFFFPPFIGCLGRRRWKLNGILYCGWTW